jgi:RNA methyltransferase, TrmH family
MVAGFQGGSHILKSLKWYESLHDSKGRDSNRAFLVEGTRAILQITRSTPERIIEIIYPEEMEKLAGLSYPVRNIPASQFKRIALSLHPAGPIAVVALPDDLNSINLPDEPGDRILILEDIQDPGNIGTLLRNAAAFDFSGVICSDKCADPFSPKATQAACGALVSLWIRRSDKFRTMIRSVKDKGYTVVAADTDGKTWKKTPADNGKIALVLGNEGNGISHETLLIADKTVKIPININRVESLNVASAGAILMYLSSVFYDNQGAAFTF